MNLNGRDVEIWRQYGGTLSKLYGITTFHTLLHVSDGMFDHLTRAQGIDMREDDRGHLKEQRRKLRIEWSTKRQPGINLQELAMQIVDQMFEHWD
eukprot:CAMPEP_0171217462 /NCGR_PEP_ID=MMETSP0790-20130122/32698_1 /TAXON_ID=2925 /ORGANISM="Alexandrium catenella, Strain OF101" /LENGTH=94 /DNA_ID=CAMNT_0011683253 /DNA_START=69 /DNA_END=350 /DNA_ORIENTATION=-